jgi:hypothetical protein
MVADLSEPEPVDGKLHQQRQAEEEKEREDEPDGARGQ